MPVGRTHWPRYPVTDTRLFVFLTHTNNDTHAHTNCAAYPQTNFDSHSHTNSDAYPQTANTCAFSWSDVHTGLSTSRRFVDTLDTTGPTE